MCCMLFQSRKNCFLLHKERKAKLWLSRLVFNFPQIDLKLFEKAELYIDWLVLLQKHQINGVRLSELETEEWCLFGNSVS